MIVRPYDVLGTSLGIRRSTHGGGSKINIRSQQRKTTLAWRPNAEYTTVLRRTTGRRTTGRRKRWYLALRLIRDVLPEDQLLAQNYMVGNQH